MSNHKPTCFNYADFERMQELYEQESADKRALLEENARLREKIVLCRDCANYACGDCKYFNASVSEYWYCWAGEKKEGKE